MHNYRKSLIRVQRKEDYQRVIQDGVQSRLILWSWKDSWEIIISRKEILSCEMEELFAWRWFLGTLRRTKYYTCATQTIRLAAGLTKEEKAESWETSA